MLAARQVPSIHNPKLELEYNVETHLHAAVYFHPVGMCSPGQRELRSEFESLFRRRFYSSIDDWAPPWALKIEWTYYRFSKKPTNSTPGAVESTPAHKAAQRCPKTKALVHKVIDTEPEATKKACSNTEISSGQSFEILHAKSNRDRLMAAVPPAVDNDERIPDIYGQASVTAPTDCETTGGDVASCLWFVLNILDIFSRLFLALILLIFAGVLCFRFFYSDFFTVVPTLDCLGRLLERYCPRS